MFFHLVLSPVSTCFICLGMVYLSRSMLRIYCASVSHLFIYPHIGFQLA